MKANLLRTSIAAMLAASAALAQSSADFKVNVPFSFIVGNQTLHAGQYTVNELGVQGAVVIKCSGCKGAAIAIGPALHSIVGRNEGRLVFHQYGNTYFLAEVWSAGNDGRQLPMTSREHVIAARLAGPDGTVIAVTR